MSKLWVLMFTAFVDMVGALMIIPLLPFYAKHLGANGFELMVIVASFSAAQLLSAPLWGRVSDRYGRRPALIAGLTAAVISYVIFAYANTLWLLLLSRLVQGAGGGTTGVVQAYVTDSVAPRNRARGLGWLSAATNLGVMLGPVLGSVTTLLGTHAPGLIAATLGALNIMFVWFFLTESHGLAARTISGARRSIGTAVFRVLRHPRDVPSQLIWMYATAIGANYGIGSLLTLFLNDRFHVTEQTIGFYFVYIGGLNVLFRLGLLGRVVDRLGEARTTRLGAVVLAAGLALIPLTYPLGLPGPFSLLLLALATALLPLGQTLTFPSITALLSQVVQDDERGLYLGVQQTYGGVSRVVYPPLAGLAWDDLGIPFPFWISAILVATTLLIGRGLTAYAQHDEAAVEQAAEQGVSKEGAVVGE
ncbi:MAG TPA: MFS transporter [Gemmatimonadaceae bacterium]|nr:MFS transporter [Gemmatimonadaceae bacterium]